MAKSSWLSRAATALAGKDRSATLAPEVFRLKAENDFYARRIAELEDHNRLLTEAASERAQRVQDQEAQLAALHAEIATLTPDVTRLKGENSFYARRVAELEEHNRLLTEAATERAKRIDDQEVQLASLHTEIATLTPDVTRLKGENSFYVRRLAELEAHNRLLTEAASGRAKRVQDQEGQLASLHTGVATLTSEVTRLTGENSFYAGRVAELEEHNRLLTEAATERAQRIQDQEHELTSLHIEIATLTSDVTRLEERVAELDVKTEQLSRQFALDRPLAFMHVPKTAGVALTHGVLEALPPTEHLNCYDRGFFGALQSSKAALPVYDALPAANGIDFVAGHITYSTLIQGRPAARLMTVLREPRSRILSLWTFYRSQSDETISRLGAFGRVVRLARRPLVEFLNHPEAACHTDNKYVRMLLWPHPLIPDDGFIDDASDEHLASEAAARLKAFAFADLIENQRLENNVRAFLARPFMYRRVNETLAMPSELRAPLDEELSREALLLLEHRSRLDRGLWRALAAERIAGADPSDLSDDTFRQTVTRHAALMRPE